MSGLEWYPRNSRKALDGMRSLSLELRGAYNTILDLIYDRGGPIPDDDRWLAGNMGVTVRRWKQIRAQLIDAGRIVVRSDPKGGVLSDDLAEKEIATQKSRREKNAVSGASGGRQSAANRAEAKENNDLPVATAQASLKLDTETGTEQRVEAIASVAGGDNQPKFHPAFELAWKAYPHVKGRSSRSKSYPQWRKAAKTVGSATRLHTAIVTFASDGRTRRSDTGAKGFHLWLRDSLYEDWLPPDGPSGSSVECPVSPAVHAQHLAHFAATGEWRSGWGGRPDKPKDQAA